MDDWSFKRGSTDGTILVDLEARFVADRLPDRRAETLAAWLSPRRRRVKVIARGRSTECARGVETGAPRAVQVADGWHLLNVTKKATVAQITHDKEVRKAAALACRFSVLVQAAGITHRRAPGARLVALTRWLSQAKTCGVQTLRTFAAEGQYDIASIKAALTTGWSNGQTEGHVNKLKLLKRRMYGRAKFDLLRRRLLLAS